MLPLAIGSTDNPGQLTGNTPHSSCRDDTLGSVSHVGKQLSLGEKQSFALTVDPEYLLSSTDQSEINVLVSNQIRN